MRFKVYINPFDDFGEYKGYTEVTDDVDFNSFSSLNQKIDQNEYDVGVFTFSDFTMKFRNDHGLYSDIDQVQSIFRTKRAGSLVKITYMFQHDRATCGWATCGLQMLFEEKTMFIGLLDDASSKVSLQEQEVFFRVMGRESIFSRVETNYASINTGDLLSTIVHTVLNQTEITDILTVSASNINVGIDNNTDSIASFNKLTVKEALDKLLKLTNSVLYVKDGIIYVTNRDESATSQYTFYGLGSNDGIESIQNLSSIKTGVNKTFNYWTWAGATISVSDATSISRIGVYKKEISETVITDTTKRTNILGNYRTEFAEPKKEFQLSTPMKIDNTELFFWDKVTVDYPTVYRPATGQVTPIYDFSLYDEAYYAIPQWTMTINTNESFKIMSKKIDFKNFIITYTLREV